ncbi:MAG TPA: M48 family metalloprotease [Syntrophorhabdaceae bacterium]|nr:M48 family metalloprotease [Syntrophorhabdaceae bacterium]
MRYKKVFALAIFFVFTIASLSFALTFDEEKKYGRQIYREIIQSAPINTDPYVSFTADSIKARLSEKAMLPFPITLTIIDSETIDAFATMGGYVYITTGLIGMCEKEEEFAGVLAHEMAHIKKRHISKRMEKEKYLNIGMVTTMLLSMLAGGGQASEAILTSGLAGVQAMALSYSREDEEEADREGSTIADKAGYGGLGSAMFLKRLRLAGLEKMLPQYLLTHPYPEARIVLLESMWKKNTVTTEEPLFRYLPARIQVLHTAARAGGDDMLINRYVKNESDPLSNYAASLVYSLKGNSDESIKTIGKNGSGFKSLFTGEMLINARKFSEAIDILKGQTDPVARFLVGKAFEGQGKQDSAISAFIDLVSYGNLLPEIYYRLGMLYGKSGSEAKGYDYLGRYYFETGKFPLAKTNLEKAVSRYGINSSESKEALRILDVMKAEKKLYG